MFCFYQLIFFQLCVEQWTLWYFLVIEKWNWTDETISGDIDIVSSVQFQLLPMRNLSRLFHRYQNVDASAMAHNSSKNINLVLRKIRDSVNSHEILQSSHLFKSQYHGNTIFVGKKTPMTIIDYPCFISYPSYSSDYPIPLDYWWAVDYYLITNYTSTLTSRNIVTPVIIQYINNVSCSSYYHNSSDYPIH